MLCGACYRDQVFLLLVVSLSSAGRAARLRSAVPSLLKVGNHLPTILLLPIISAAGTRASIATLDRGDSCLPKRGRSLGASNSETLLDMSITALLFGRLRDTKLLCRSSHLSPERAFCTQVIAENRSCCLEGLLITSRLALRRASPKPTLSSPRHCLRNVGTLQNHPRSNIICEASRQAEIRRRLSQHA